MTNDSGNLLQEARMALLLARLRDAAALTAREALAIAPRGGARVLGRDDSGYLAPDMTADFIAINLNRPELAGALHDPGAALLFCHISGVDYSFIHRRKVVDPGHFTPLDLPQLVETYSGMQFGQVHPEPQTPNLEPRI